jgi:conjugal transfer pilus assembly protein TrbC
MRILLTSLLIIISTFAHAKMYVFVSFAMPHQLLVETLQESNRLHIAPVLNGLYHNSMLDTTHELMSLSKEIPNVQLQVDPTLFERFSIEKVPALVVTSKSCFDVIYGNLALSEGIQRIQRQGECR